MWEGLDAYEVGWKLFPLPQCVLQKACPCPILLDKGLEVQLTTPALTLDDQRS